MVEVVTAFKYTFGGTDDEEEESLDFAQLGGMGESVYFSLDVLCSANQSL